MMERNRRERKQSISLEHFVKERARERERERTTQTKVALLVNLLQSVMSLFLFVDRKKECNSLFSSSLFEVRNFGTSQASFCT